MGLQLVAHQLQMAALDILDVNDPPAEFLALQAQWKRNFKNCEALDEEEGTTSYTRLPVSSLEELELHETALLQLIDPDTYAEEEDDTAPATGNAERAGPAAQSTPKRTPKRTPKAKKTAGKAAPVSKTARTPVSRVQATPSKKGTESAPIDVEKEDQISRVSDRVGEQIIESLKDLTAGLSAVSAAQDDLVSRFSALEKRLDNSEQYASFDRHTALEDSEFFSACFSELIADQRSVSDRIPNLQLSLTDLCDQVRVLRGGDLPRRADVTLLLQRRTERLQQRRRALARDQ